MPKLISKCMLDIRYSRVETALITHVNGQTIMHLADALPIYTENTNNFISLQR